MSSIHSTHANLCQVAQTALLLIRRVQLTQYVDLQNMFMGSVSIASNGSLFIGAMNRLATAAVHQALFRQKSQGLQS